MFRIFYSPIAVMPETTDFLVTTACCLHNVLRIGYLETHNTPYYNTDPNVELPQDNLIAFTRTAGFASTKDFAVRDQFRTYFNSPQGSVTWQEKTVSLNKCQHMFLMLLIYRVNKSYIGCAIMKKQLHMPLFFEAPCIFSNIFKL